MVRLLDPVMPSALAVMVAVPCVKLAANPESVASLLAVATPVFEELHSTDAKLSEFPLLNVPIAVKNCCPPMPTDGVAGVTAMLVSPFNWLAM